MVSKDNAGIKEVIWKIALLNATKYGGKAKVRVVIDKILGANVEYRSEVKKLSDLVQEVVWEVNELSVKEQKRMILEKWPENFIKREKLREEKYLPLLPNAEKYEQVITRFAPNPDCVLHLGSARAIVLDYKYARMYKGKFILRFEDTDPKTKRPVLEFYDRIREDLDWLECTPDEEYIQSDRIPIYYKYAKKLLEDGNAYICVCSSEHFRKKVLTNEPCECRDQTPEAHLLRWQRMLDGSYKEGEAVLRVKTNLAHPNPAVRDWPAMRIIASTTHPHPRVGSTYNVWPLYNLAAGIDDHLMGITHIIRGKEHLTNQVRQEFLYQYLGWQYPEAIHYGRLKIKGAYLSKSKILQGMHQGLFTSWDDPRLATFAALRRRGIHPEAIKTMMVSIGPKPSDVILSWKNLYAYNRKILDPIVDRYFFVNNPVEFTVAKIPSTFKVRIRLHPDKPERGYKEYTIIPRGDDNNAMFWVSENDIQDFEVGSLLRLMELFNVKIREISGSSVNASFLSESYEQARNSKAPLIHWIQIEEAIPSEIVMPDSTVAEGVAEKACAQLKPNRIIQFERFGFVRIERVNTKLIGYFAHK